MTRPWRGAGGTSGGSDEFARVAAVGGEHTSGPIASGTIAKGNAGLNTTD